MDTGGGGNRVKVCCERHLWNGPTDSAVPVSVVLVVAPSSSQGKACCISEFIEGGNRMEGEEKERCRTQVPSEITQ